MSKMSDKIVEKHPLGFFLPANAKLLMLGSFPPKRERWSMNFYYPNIQNDMWRIIGLLFFGNKEHFLTETKKAFDEVRIRAFCQEKGFAFGDTAMEVVRLKDNASDKFLEVVKPFNPEEVLSRLPECHAIVITGQKAMDTLLSVLPAAEPRTGCYVETDFNHRQLKIFRMPSSSRAYPMPLEKKAQIYLNMFKELGML